MPHCQGLLQCAGALLRPRRSARPPRAHAVSAARQPACALPSCMLTSPGRPSCAHYWGAISSLLPPTPPHLHPPLPTPSPEPTPPAGHRLHPLHSPACGPGRPGRPPRRGRQRHDQQLGGVAQRAQRHKSARGGVHRGNRQRHGQQRGPAGAGGPSASAGGSSSRTHGAAHAAGRRAGCGGGQRMS